MNFSTKALQESIKKLAGVGRGNIAEVQKGILFANNQLISANSEIAMAIPTDPVMLPETFVIPNRAFGFLSALDGDEVEITEENGVLHMVSGKAKSSVQTFTVETFVKPNFTLTEHRTEIPAETLHASLDRVLYAVSDDPKASKMLTGAFFHAESGILKIAGTNGHKLAIATVPMEGDMKMIIPKKSLLELQKMKLKGRVVITSDDKGVTFASDDGAALYSRLIDGEYFNVEQLIAANKEFSILKKMELLEAMRRVIACGGTGNEKLPVIMEFTGKELNISYNGITQYEETIEDIDIGKELKIAFNPKYIYEVLQATPGDDVQVSLMAPNAPMQVRGDGVTSVILPVAIR